MDILIYLYDILRKEKNWGVYNNINSSGRVSICTVVYIYCKHPLFIQINVIEVWF